MSVPYRAPGLPSGGEQSLRQLVDAAKRDLAALVKLEKELAVVELRQTAKLALPAAIALTAAAVAGLLFLIVGSVALSYGIGNLLDSLAWGFTIVAGIWLLLLAVGGLFGLREAKKISGPERTIRTVKDTADWARHPTSSPSDAAIAVR